MKHPAAPRDSALWRSARFGGGGSESKPQTTTQTTTSAPWAAQQPYLKELFSEAQGQYFGDTPSYFPGPTVAPFSPESLQAQDAIFNRATMGSPVQAAGNQTMLDTIQGKYLDVNTNPYLSGYIDTATRPITQNFTNTVMPSVSSMFSSAGRYGSGAHTDAVGNATDAYLRNLGDVGSSIAYQNYGNERNAMGLAAANAPAYAAADYNDPAQLASLGASKEAQQQALINADIQRHNFEQNLPAAKLAQYGNMVSGNYGGTMSGTSTTPYYQKSGSALQGAAGGALSGAAAGAPAGPWGAAGGAVIGGGLGAASSK